MSDARRVALVLSTVTEDKAEALAIRWVESRRAACVTTIPGAQSVYRWKSAIVKDREVVLLIKTAFDSAEEGRRLLASFAEDHPYDEPEFLVFHPEDGAPGYVSWVLSSVAGGS